MTITRNFKDLGLGLFYFIWNNFFLLFLVSFFAYRTFFVGRLNYALLVLLVALLLIIICRAISHYLEHVTTTIMYRALVLLSAGLLITAICIQTLRFIFVFVPTMTEPTVSKILVRVGIATANFYVFALLIAAIYYLYAHNMTEVIWNGSFDRLLRTTFSPKGPHHWRQVRFSSLVLMYTFVWGGLISVITLAAGLIAWLLR